MQSIAILIPYFGTLPPMFRFWRLTALANPSIDFILLTDQPVPSEANVRVVRTSFAECCGLVRGKFDFPLDLNGPYRLTELKPAYGHIFADLLSGYDFWGYGDIDLVYGSLRHFLSEEVLRRHDFISGYGHLTLCRNSDECRRLFMRRDAGFQYYADVFSRPGVFHFDEYGHGGMGDRIAKLWPRRLWRTDTFDDMLKPHDSNRFVPFGKSGYEGGLVFRHDGERLWRIYMDGRHIAEEQSLYAHFQQRARWMHVRTGADGPFIVKPNSFIADRPVTASLMRRWTREGPIARLVCRTNWRFRDPLKTALMRIATDN